MQANVRTTSSSGVQDRVGLARRGICDRGPFDGDISPRHCRLRQYIEPGPKVVPGILLIVRIVVVVVVVVVGVVVVAVVNIVVNSC